MDSILEFPKLEEITTKSIKGGDEYDDYPWYEGGGGGGDTGDGSYYGDSGDSGSGGDPWWNNDPNFVTQLPEFVCYSDGSSSYEYDGFAYFFSSDGNLISVGDVGGGGGSGSDGASASVSGSTPYVHFDEDSDMAHRIWNGLQLGISGAVNITGMAVDISKLVDSLGADELSQLGKFGKSLGIAGTALGGYSLTMDVIEEGHFDANDALNLAGIGIGVAAIFVSAPVAVALGVGGLIISVAAGTGVGDDAVIFDFN